MDRLVIDHFPGDVIRVGNVCYQFNRIVSDPLTSVPDITNVYETCEDCLVQYRYRRCPVSGDVVSPVSSSSISGDGVSPVGSSSGTSSTSSTSGTSGTSGTSSISGDGVSPVGSSISGDVVSPVSSISGDGVSPVGSSEPREDISSG